MTPKAIGLDELATVLHVSERVILDDIKEGRLPGTKVGNSWRFTRTDIEVYLGNRRAADLFGPRALDYGRDFA